MIVLTMGNSCFCRESLNPVGIHIPLNFVPVPVSDKLVDLAKHLIQQHSFGTLPAVRVMRIVDSECALRECKAAYDIAKTELAFQHTDAV